ncbi:SRPBCC family protein, partial [Sabulibacter ruber]|uniref:SRPBCC family protein n=1 Tax=Sabulibacter ruber TaxID=2811901 RepID=UPI002418B686
RDLGEGLGEGGLDRIGGGVAGLIPSARREPTTTQSGVTIAAQPERLFRFWRNFGNLPKIMDHLEAVEIESEKRSHWKAKGPGGVRLDWFSEIERERENELISWH